MASKTGVHCDQTQNEPAMLTASRPGGAQVRPCEHPDHITIGPHKKPLARHARVFSFQKEDGQR